MTTDHTPMWKDLGLNIEAHDALLSVLGQAYGDIYLAQKKRPENMGYFDFVMSEVHGQRIQELVDARAEGRKVIGCYCVFVPEEITLAAEAVHVGLCSGADFAMDEVEKYLPRNTCALIKSSMGFKLAKVCPYLECSDLVVGENTCDGKKKAYETLSTMMDNLYVMDLPQVKSAEGKALLKAEFIRYKEAVEALTGKTIDVAALKKGIAIVNDKRKAMARLAALRQGTVLPISGLDALIANQVFFYDDPVRFTASVNALCDELEKRIAEKISVIPEGTPRILVSGCPMAVPNWKLPAIIETSGAVIVAEESCVGERGCRNLTDDSSDDLDGLIDALVDRYLAIDCAIFTPNTERTDHIKELAKASKADGVIQYTLNFCQPYALEAMPIEKELEEGGLPTLRIETDYSQEDMGQLQTRVEAFVELLK
ncbi:double-cubane-cluster-containing anaerobic reductase [Desulfoluna sp.]|uniref:double-cubane-cluster-containing anaerobic reductase n=1 Tax=Desulfoluna sp. TaxID=2045199 RepID=UPI00262D1024|nr:double-cubane-cluster-containing anaerobic reductase [Desulfoluna sp.]